MPFKIRGRGRPKKKTGMNGLETWYAEQLQADLLTGKILYWAYEPLKFKLADGAWYTPDFLVMHPMGEIQLVETKGHWEEAARVRIKVAAQIYPFEFVALTCRCSKRRWSIEKTEVFGAEA